MEMIKVLLTSLLSVAALFAMAKIMGHKQVAQLDFFDYITGITIGSIAAEMATELGEPWKPFIAMVLYGGTTLLMSGISSRWPRTRKYLNGTPTILMDHGRLYPENLKKAKLDGVNITDDCSAVEHMGMSVKIVEGDEKNIKITTPLDLKIAELILEESK